MTKKTVQPEDSDAELFRQAISKVTPLAPANRAEVSAPSPHPAQAAQRVEKSTHIKNYLSNHGAEDIALTEFMRSGISRMELRKLRRGHWRIQDSLDLHGLTSDQAQKLLLQFLYAATANNLRCVCIIHGKGWHTEGKEGVLKSRSRYWLTQCAEVLAFCEAPPHEGGSGAVKVLLKKGNPVNLREKSV